MDPHRPCPHHDVIDDLAALTTRLYVRLVELDPWPVPVERYVADEAGAWTAARVVASAPVPVNRASVVALRSAVASLEAIVGPLVP